MTEVLLNMKVDWGDARDGLSGPHGAGFESTGNPEASTPLHFAE